MAELSDVLTASRVPARLGRFVLRMFRPQIYVTYGVLWTLALEGSAEALSGSAAHWTPSWSTVARAVSVVLALLFARMVDEQKDLEYDRTHNPDRPLVTGAITAAELRGAMAFSTVVVVVLNTFVSAFSVLLILLALGYTLFLVALERRFPRFGERLIANLLVSYPVQLLLSGYLYVSLLTGDEIGGDGRAAPSWPCSPVSSSSSSSRGRPSGGGTRGHGCTRRCSARVAALPSPSPSPWARWPSGCCCSGHGGGRPR
ncbi:hypothetical protein ACFQ2Y_44795 [Streptomyces malaysiensis subsp. malaysiensis]